MSQTVMFCMSLPVPQVLAHGLTRVDPWIYLFLQQGRADEVTAAGQWIRRAIPRQGR